VKNYKFLLTNLLTKVTGVAPEKDPMKKSVDV